MKTMEQRRMKWHRDGLEEGGFTHTFMASRRHGSRSRSQASKDG
jgi:hypothetical protein